MNCKIESMSDNRRNNVDTLPPRGRVNEVRREWLVHEDGALAYRLQDEEIKQHLIGNKSRNLQIREDIPRAKSEQLREAEEAAKLHQQLLTQQEQQDAQVAAQLAEMIEREEEERRRMLEEEDKELARYLQEKEKQRIEKRERDKRELESHTPRKEKPHHSDERRVLIPKGPNFRKEPLTNQSSSSDVEYSQPLDSVSNNNAVYYDDNLSDINNVGLPLQDDIIQPLRICNLNGYSSYDSKNLPSPSSMTEDDFRRMQEEKDEELARFLQEKENLENVDTVNRDRLLAIETQDKELARLLQEKERAKARRARERAKQKAALKRMQEEGNAEALATSDEQITIKTAETVSVSSHKSSCDDNLSYKTNSSSLRPETKTSAVKTKPRYPDPEEIVELPPDKSLTPINIAMTIDPTYSKESMERISKHKKSSRHIPVDDCEQISSIGMPIQTPVPEIVQDVNAPPYMPIQGQRRLPEKKTKQKDGCKQQ